MSLCRLIRCSLGTGPATITTIVADRTRTRVSRRSLSSARSGGRAKKPVPLTAGLCAIGDIFLLGKAQEENSRYFAKRCYELGVEMKKIEIVPEVSKDIATSVVNMSKQYDVVFTCGGTNDSDSNIIYGAVAKAFGKQLEYSTQTLERMKVKLREKGIVHPPDLHGSSEQVKKAQIALFPKGHTLKFPCSEIWNPVVCVEGNIHLFPQFPKLSEKLVDAYLPELVRELSRKHDQPFTRAFVGTWAREAVVVRDLQLRQKLYTQRKIRVGLYPNWMPSNKDTTHLKPGTTERSMVMVTFTGEDEKVVIKSKDELLEKLNGFLV
ncbi:3-hydroxyanthranilic acid dioxygenase [Coemansia sp. Benny D160-2]|nr:3-hydroxyanthranilic acid dioxygenase [Coemansia sp. Benny D160-2]